MIEKTFCVELQLKHAVVLQAQFPSCCANTRRIEVQSNAY